MDLGEAIGAKVENELEVGVRRFRLLAVGVVVGALGLSRLGEELRLVFGEEIELTANEVFETAAAQSQRSSR